MAIEGKLQAPPSSAQDLLCVQVSGNQPVAQQGGAGVAAGGDRLTQ